MESVGKGGCALVGALGVILLHGPKEEPRFAAEGGEK